MCCRPRHQCRSQLPVQTEREREEKEGSQTAGHVTLHFPLLSTCRPHVSAAPRIENYPSQQLNSVPFISFISSFLTIPFSQLHCASPSLLLTQSVKHTSAVFWNIRVKKEGVESKGGERDGQAERHRHEGAAASSQLHRYGLLASWGICS